jgi:PucR family transcriptional regulator, purine catabolism regulatory protein
VHALISIKDRSNAAATRAVMLHALRTSNSAQQALVIVVGPVVPSLRSASLSLVAALEVAASESAFGGRQRGVIDAHDRLVDRLVLGEGQSERLAQLIEGELAMFDPLPPKTRLSLLNTLEAYFDSGCDKSATANALHVTRQALYTRLSRAFVVLGSDPSGTPRALGLHLALRMRHLR